MGLGYITDKVFSLFAVICPCLCYDADVKEVEEIG